VLEGEAIAAYLEQLNAGDAPAAAADVVPMDVGA
jgi:hypothetical protein